jgi:exopolysaccharide production protein ExoZ
VERLASIQALRGLAALGVVVYHAAGWKFGSFGVDLFFVISGYVITKSSRGKTPGAFLLDRVWRIYPIYWVAVLPWIFIASDVSIGRTIASLTLWPVYGNSFVQPYLVVGWTLCFEMLFYLAFAFSMARKSPLIPFAVFLVSMAGLVVYPVGLFWFLGSPMIFGFLAGVGLASVPEKPKAALWLLPLAILILAFSNPALMAQREIATTVLRDVSRLLWWTAPAVVIVYSAICYRRLFTSWVRPFVTLGEASYSLYLFHPLVTHLLEVNWVVETALSVALGLGAWWFVERRILAAKPYAGRRAICAAAHDAALPDAPSVVNGPAAPLPSQTP